MYAYRSARLLIDQHGADALIEAALKADELLDQGDLDGQAVWLRFRKAVLELLKPGDGETVHKTHSGESVFSPFGRHSRADGLFYAAEIVGARAEDYIRSFAARQTA